DRRPAPKLSAAKHARHVVDSPPRGEVPVQVLAQRLEDPRYRLLDRERFRQYPGGSMLCDRALLSPLALGQIEYECHAFVRGSLEHRAACQNLHASAILPEEFPFLSLRSCARSEIFHLACVALAPFRQRKVRPPHAPRDQVIAAVTDDASELLVGVKDPAVRMPAEDPDDAGVDQPPNPRFALCELAIQPGVLD